MTYRVNLAKAHWGAEKLNVILPALQAQFEASLNEGVLLQLEEGTVAWVDETLSMDEPGA